MKRLTIVLAALLATTGTAAAAADNYRGRTSQKKPASARVVDGRLKLVKLSWSIPCQAKGFRLYNGTKWTDTTEGPIEQPGDGTFTDSGRRTTKLASGERVKFKETLSGRFDGQHVAGKSTITAKVYNSSGKQIDTCKGTIKFDVPKV